MRTKTSPLAALGLILCSLVIGIVCAEVALRILHYRYPYMRQLDSVTGISLAPNTEKWQREEGYSYVKINSDGMRDREHAIEKPTDTIRIAILGDSYTEAEAVPVEKTFSTLLESELASCPDAEGKMIETLNFGVGGYGTDQELLTLRSKAWKYKPDVVLVVMTTSNDISDNAHVMHPDQVAPYFHFVNGTLTLDTSFAQSPQFTAQQSWTRKLLLGIYNRSSVLQLLNRGRIGLSQLADRVEPPASSGPALPAGLQSDVYKKPTDPKWIEAWKVTEGLLTMLRDEAHAGGASFGIVTGSNSIQVLPDPAARKKVEAELGVSDLFYPDNRIAAFAKSISVPALTLAPLLREKSAEQNFSFHSFGTVDGHWNERAHGEIAALLGQFVCQKGLLKPLK
jgi:hypothetical protein